MKKIFILALVGCVCSFNMNGQERGKLRIGWDLGLNSSEHGIGGSFSIEPKYNLSNRLSIGLKNGAIANTKEIDYNLIFLESVDIKHKLNITRFYSVICDYYFPKPNRKIVPFAGLGLGIFNTDGIEVDFDFVNINDVNYTFNSYNEFGMFSRAGFEFGKFKFGIEYFFIPDTDINDDGDFIGTVSNQFLNVSVGAFLGGGKW